MLTEVSKHGEEFGCSLGTMFVKGERIRGFLSTIILQCRMCSKSFEIPTDNESVDVNKSFVLGMMNIGSGYSHMQQLSASLNMPCMSNRFYEKIQDEIVDIWESAALDNMKSAAMEEKKLAIEAGDVDCNGTPTITVVCDGSWAKRSHKTNYSSLSGTAAIIGFRTKKVLFIGVRNKFCVICNQAQTKNITVKSHPCYKNWNGSATSMEADIIAEGFCRSQQDYGLIYAKMIADGDSSCYKKILERNPYKNLKVQKIECRNHLLRNYINKMRELSKNVTLGPLTLRKEIEVRFIFIYLF